MPEETPKPIEQAIKEVQQQSVSGPVEVTLDDGTVVKAANYQEAFQVVSKMKVDTAVALRDREQQIRDLQATQQQQVQQTQQPVKTGFDQKHYWELAGQSVMDAQNYLDQHRFGLNSPEEVPQVFQSMHNTSVKTGDDFEVKAFISRNPDWPATDAASQYMMDKLKEEKRPLTSENLEYIYLRGVRDGAIEPLAQEQTGTFIPPTLGGSSPEASGKMGSLQDFASLSADQQQEVLKKAGMYQ